MKQIKADLIESCKRNAGEIPEYIQPEILGDGLEMMVTGVMRLMSDAPKGPKVSELLGMDAASLDKVREWCHNAVLRHTKGELLQGVMGLNDLGWTPAEVIYAAYWIGLYEGGLR